MTEHPQSLIRRMAGYSVQELAEYAKAHGVDATAEQYLIGTTTVRRAMQSWSEWQERNRPKARP